MPEVIHAAILPRVTGRRYTSGMVKRRLQIMALALVVAAAVALLLVPTYTSATWRSEGLEITTVQGVLDVVGPWVFVVLLAPVALTIPPLSAHARAWVVVSIICAAGLWLSVIVGLFTVGRFFVPGAIIAVLAACLPARAEARSRVSPSRR
jgi:hypothetical protein